MKKGRDYERLQHAGLPIPDYGVFDDSSLQHTTESQRLSHLVSRILTAGSGQIGVRTEPQEGASPLGIYPHIMPLRSENHVREAMKLVLREHPNHSWWFLVNEAFTEYEWNAVVMLSDQLPFPGPPRLTGEVNDQDNVPLRKALEITANCKKIEDWHHPDAPWLRSVIHRSGIINEWLEVSSVYARGKPRKVFWGMR